VRGSGLAFATSVVLLTLACGVPESRPLRSGVQSSIPDPHVRLSETPIFYVYEAVGTALVDGDLESVSIAARRATKVYSGLDAVDAGFSPAAQGAFEEVLSSLEAAGRAVELADARRHYLRASMAFAQLVEGGGLSADHIRREQCGTLVWFGHVDRMGPAPYRCGEDADG
jgi:hypothetical protein